MRGAGVGGILVGKHKGAPASGLDSRSVATQEVAMHILPQLPSSLIICPECDGRGEYRYLYDHDGSRPPYHVDNRMATGWHDGFWWKRCWHCMGKGVLPGGVD